MNRIETFAQALRANEASQLRDLLASSPECRARIDDPLPGSSFGSTPLLEAVNRGHTAVVDVLLDAGADPNRKSDWWAGGFGVLDSAKPELVPHLLARGARLTPHAAARLGMLSDLQRLLNDDPSLAHARGGDGQTPLHFASTIPVADFLLSQGADIDARDIDHESTPAQYMTGDRVEIARFLVSRGCQTDLLMAAAMGDLDLARKHLDADPESVRMYVSPEWFPMRGAHAGGTIYLWALGADRSPHQVAHDRGYPELLHLLMDRSPTALKFARACQVGDETRMKECLAPTRDLIHTLSKEELRALPDSAKFEDLEAVRRMLQSGWPVDAPGQHGGTALHWSAWLGNAKLVREVLQYRPSLENRNNDWNATALEWARHGSLNSWRATTGDYPGVIEAIRKHEPPKYV